MVNLCFIGITKLCIFFAAEKLQYDILRDILKLGESINYCSLMVFHSTCFKLSTENQLHPHLQPLLASIDDQSLCVFTSGVQSAMT